MMSTPYDKYTLAEKDLSDLDRRFTYHRPSGDQLDRMGLIRTSVMALALLLSTLCPKSRELSIALARLEEVMMMANASIVRNEPEVVVRRKTVIDPQADAAHQPILSGLS